MPDLTDDFRVGNVAAILAQQPLANLYPATLGTLVGIVHDTSDFGGRVAHAQPLHYTWADCSYNHISLPLGCQLVSNPAAFGANRVTANISALPDHPVWITSAILTGCTVCCLYLKNDKSAIIDRVRMLHIGADGAVIYPPGTNKRDNHMWRVTHAAAGTPASLEDHYMRILADADVSGGMIIHNFDGTAAPAYGTYVHPTNGKTLKWVHYQYSGICHCIIYREGSDRHISIGAAAYHRNGFTGRYEADIGSALTV